MSGRFITLEGSEGAGKSTNVDIVCETLTEAGIDFIRTENPEVLPWPKRYGMPCCTSGMKT